MNEVEQIKQVCLTTNTADVEQLMKIIGDLTFAGYKISLCKLKGYSYKQCAIRFGITKRQAQVYYEKCNRNGYDTVLKRIFQLQ